MCSWQTLSRTSIYTYPSHDWARWCCLIRKETIENPRSWEPAAESKNQCITIWRILAQYATDRARNGLISHQRTQAKKQHYSHLTKKIRLLLVRRSYRINYIYVSYRKTFFFLRSIELNGINPVKCFHTSNIHQTMRREISAFINAFRATIRYWECFGIFCGAWSGYIQFAQTSLSQYLGLLQYIVTNRSMNEGQMYLLETL